MGNAGVVNGARSSRCGHCGVRPVVGAGGADVGDRRGLFFRRTRSLAWVPRRFVRRECDVIMLTMMMMMMMMLMMMMMIMMMMMVMMMVMLMVLMMVMMMSMMIMIMMMIDDDDY